MKKQAYSVAIIIALIFTNCSPVKMAVSDDLKNNHDEYEVKGRQGILINQKLSFGGYKTSKVKRSWTKGQDALYGIGYTTAQQDWVNLISTEYIDIKQTIHFSLSDSRQQSEVFCVSKFNANDIHIGKNPNSLLNIGLDLSGKGGKSESIFYVQVYIKDDGGRPWEMAIDNQRSQADAKNYIGYLAKSKNEYYTIVPVTKLEMKGKTGNTLLGAVGFEFRDMKGNAVAAVSPMDNGMVFLAKTTAEERFLLANACAALLLQQEIE